MTKLLATLGLVLLLAAGAAFWWQTPSQPATADVAEQDAVAAAAPIEAASPAQELALTEEAVDALATENAELEARIADLEAQNADAEKLIALKTARLQELEKTQPAQ